MLLLKKVFNLFNVEKQCSHSTVGMENVHNYLTLFEIWGRYSQNYDGVQNILRQSVFDVVYGSSSFWIELSETIYRIIGCNIDLNLNNI